MLPAQTRSAGGMFQSNAPALARFIAKCRHDPGTGCVIWTGGTTSGRGHHAPYGSFWFEGRRWFAHRWAARFIHGQVIDDHQVDHNCPTLPAPNTLCVQHVQAVPPSINRELQWVRTQVGLLPSPPRFTGELFSEPPFYEAPTWLTIDHLDKPKPGIMGTTGRVALAHMQT